ncbi:unnamed protein product [Allacma fusca]|uniref:Uncharacterized protein n=1 Tax=Allacma fusca TaxID=39272 RepID=A0A8J2PI29_9HEXA|nr:unnamed protein product [Allacma fusca]
MFKRELVPSKPVDPLMMEFLKKNGSTLPLFPNRNFPQFPPQNIKERIKRRSCLPHQYSPHFDDHDNPENIFFGRLWKRALEHIKLPVRLPCRLS